MAKKATSYSEAELIKMFQLRRLAGNHAHPLMQELTDTSTILNDGEQYIFDDISENLLTQIVGWNEEMLKMNLIAFVLRLGHLKETEQYKTYYESNLEDTVQGYFLKVRAYMMVASGILETPETPYFYFQEYKKLKDPKGDVAAQLLEAFLIAIEQNDNNNPMYGCTVSGKYWEFFVMQHQVYCISETYDCTKKQDLMQIIAILRKFKEILDNRLLK